MCIKTKQRAMFCGVVALTAAVALPASAASIDVPLQSVSGSVSYDTANGVSPGGSSSPTRDGFVLGANFSIPDISSTQFNTVIGGGTPLAVDLMLSGSFSGQTETLNISNTFSSQSDLINFVGGSYSNFGSGQLTGDFGTIGLTDVVASLSDLTMGEAPGSGNNQITGGTFNIGANVPSIEGSGSATFEGGSGTLTLTNVTAVPAPSGLALVAFGLIGAGLLWRCRQV